MKRIPTLREKVSQISIAAFLVTILIMLTSFAIYSVKKTKIEEDHVIEELTHNLQAQINQYLPSFLLPEQSQGIQLLLDKMKRAESLESAGIVPKITDVTDLYPDCSKKNEDFSVCFNHDHTESVIVAPLEESGEIFGYLVKIKKTTSPNSFKELLQISGLLLFVLGVVFLCIYIFITTLLRKTLPKSIDTLVQMIESELNGNRESVELPFKELEDLKGKILEVLDRYSASRDQAMIGQLTSGIMHDIKTPLQSIVSAMHLVEEQDKDSSKRLSRLENAQLMNKINLPIICNIIETTLDGNREIKVELKEENIDLTVQRSVQRSIEIASFRNIKVENNLASEVQVVHDSTQFDRVVSNLLKNAIEAASESDKKIVKVCSFVYQGQYHLSIQDSGPGFNSTDKIFKPFQTTKLRGTGLGLFISKKIVEAHGGSLIVSRSESLGGACLTVSLPKNVSGALYEQSF